MANFYQSQTVSGLATITINIPSAGTYEIDGKITRPINQDTGLQSQVVATISKTTTGTIYTGQAGARGFHINQYCAANDVITIVLSSSAPVDQGLNIIKSTISVSEAV